MDSEENETSCSACQEINSDPRRIACGHSFCLKCLQQVAGNNEKFPCPICRFDVDRTHTNVDQLLKNVVFCNVIEARDTKQPSMCLDHNKWLDLFCQGCDAVICSKCLTMHHKGHAIEDIEIIFIERNKQIEAFLESTKHLASMAQDKSNAVKQSRISMEKNIDSISKTVENTFKKWYDALQKQQNVIFSYLHQERDQERQVFVEAERILAGCMTTVTGLDTEINKLRCKDTALVVQQYGSIKARQEDTERKVLREIETCFTPSDNLVLEVYAPWIEEAINNIKHIDMKQTQARPGRLKIAEIQDENVILKRECEKFRNTLQELERETRRLQVENKYLKLILDDLHKSIIVGEATLQMELKPPEDIKNDKLLMELTANTRKINLKFYELETELNYIHRTISQLTSMIVGDDRSNDPTQEKTNKFTATGRQPKRNPAMKFEQREQSSKIDKDIELVTSVWRNLKEKEIGLSASKQEMANKIEDYEQNYEKLRAEHQNLKTAYTTLYERYNEANAKLSGFEKSLEEKTKEYQQKHEKEEKSKAEIVAKLRKTEQALNDKSVTRPERPRSAYPIDYLGQRHNRDEMQMKIDEQQSVIDRLTTLKTQKKEECERYCSEMDALKGKLKHCEQIITSLKEEKLKNERTIIELRDENNKLLNRLSKIASDRLTHENTDITDLRDETCPSKLAEKMSELYDNQWTSAFDEMKTNRVEDEEAIGILLKIVMETNQVCKTMALSHYQKLNEACTCFEYSSSSDAENKEKGEIITKGNISIEMQQDIKRIWRESSKKVLKKVIPIIRKKVAEQFEIPLLQMKQAPRYMQDCAELCWMMNIQEKPMHLDISVPEKDGHKYFDTEKFRSYTNTGQHVAFVVWPALYLFERGSLLEKGVAQGFRGYK